MTRETLEVRSDKRKPREKKREKEREKREKYRKRRKKGDKERKIRPGSIIINLHSIPKKKN